MKPTFTKLGLKINNTVKTIIIGDQEIEVKQYLPVNNKLEIIENVISQAMDNNNFANPVKLNVFLRLEIIFNYTNISFTDKQKEDLVKLYDILESNHIFTTVIDALPEEEYNTLVDNLFECADNLYQYRNSVYGIMEVLGKDYSNLDVDINSIQEKLGNLGDIDLLRSVMAKLG